MEKRPLIVLTGPTAVGKTEAAIFLAKCCDGEIISADSMQVYRNMDIGTAKISPEEMQGIPHYMIDELEPDEEFNVFLFQKKAKAYIEDIYARGKLPILVGGTGFYIQAVLYDIAFTEEKEEVQPNGNGAVRQKLEEEVRTCGRAALYQRLLEVDPDYAKTVHENNVKRVIRALEYHTLTGKTFSSHNKEQRKRTSPYHYVYFVLNTDRETLYQNINRRVDVMVQTGLIEEVKHLLELGYERSLVSMQGLGYKEIAAALCGECRMEEAIDILKRDTRHFAKRQLTWFRRERDVCMIEKGHFPSNEKLVEEMLRIARQKGVLK